jgi:hypothetical protein
METRLARLQALLDKYQDEGVIDLDDPKVLKVAPFTGMGTPMQIVKQFRLVPEIRGGGARASGSALQGCGLDDRA